jgi:hypothetical protein
MQQRIIWQTTEGQVVIGRRIEQLGILMLFKDKTFGTFAEYVNYVKCRQCEVTQRNAEFIQELDFMEYMFKKQDKVGQSHSVFVDFVNNLETVDKVGNATST